MSDMTPDQVAAAQLRQQAASQPAPDAGQVDEATRSQSAPPLLPQERQIEQLIEQIKAQGDQLAALQRQVTGVQAAQAPPAQVNAAGVATLAKAHAAASPDVAEHLSPLTDAAAKLRDLVHSDGDREEIGRLVAEVEAFVTGPHPKALDFSALLSDLRALQAAL